MTNETRRKEIVEQLRNLSRLLAYDESQHLVDEKQALEKELKELDQNG